jgi:hypothetical protein
MKNLLTLLAVPALLSLPMTANAQDGETKSAWEAVKREWSFTSGGQTIDVKGFDNWTSEPMGKNYCAMHLYDSSQPYESYTKYTISFNFWMYANDAPKAGIPFEKVPFIKDSTRLAIPLLKSDGSPFCMDPDLWGPQPKYCAEGVVYFDARSEEKAKKMQSSLQMLIQACSQY